MKTLLRSELKKLLSVRSTFIVSALVLFVNTAVAFYFEGWKGNSGSAAAMLAPTALNEIIINGVAVAVQATTIIAILFIVHEYRYNLITYTLTSSNSRLKVLLAKVMVISGFALGLVIVASLLGLASYWAGLSLRDATLPAQDLAPLSLAWRIGLFTVGSTIFAFLISLAVRSAVAAFAIVFVVAGTIETLLGILLKQNDVYQPFTALQQLLVPPGEQTLAHGSLSHIEAAWVTVVYLLLGGLVSAWLFVRRDAN